MDTILVGTVNDIRDNVDEWIVYVYVYSLCIIFAFICIYQLVQEFVHLNTFAVQRGAREPGLLLAIEEEVKFSKKIAGGEKL